MWVFSLIKDNCSLDCALVFDALQCLAVVLELEHLVDDAFNLDLAAVEIVNGSSYLYQSQIILKNSRLKGHLTEHVGFRERSNNGNLISKDFGWRPRYPIFVGIHPKTQSALSKHPLGHCNCLTHIRPKSLLV